MTMIDTLSDQHYKSREKLAWEFATILNQEARELQDAGVDVIQFDEPAFTVFHDEVQDWGVAALERAAEGCAPRPRAHLLRLRHRGEQQVEGDPRRRVAAVRAVLPAPAAVLDRHRLARVHPLPRPARTRRAHPRQEGHARRGRRRHRDRRDPDEVAEVLRRALEFVVDVDKLIPSSNCGMAPLARGAALGKLSALSAGADIVRAELANVAVPAGR